MLHTRHTAKWGLTVLALPATLALGPISRTPANAQDTTGTSKTPAVPGEKTVSVDAEDATLYSVLTTLMQNVGANYTLDNNLRTVRVSAHLHNVRLDLALNVLLRSVTPPYTYRVEEGVYRFVPKVEPTVPETVGTDGDTLAAPNGLKHIQVVKVNFIDAAFAAQILGGIPIRSPEGQTYGLVDPLKLNGAITAPPTGGNSGAAGAGGAAAPGNGTTASGANGASSALPANLFDYLWIVNAGAYR